MQHSIEPLSRSHRSDLDTSVVSVTYKDWFPGEGVIQCSENGSTEKAKISSFIVHSNRFVREFVTSDVTVLLTLDVHISQGGYEWLEICRENRIEVIYFPADTSHFLQPCDQRVNKTFKQTVRVEMENL